MKTCTKCKENKPVGAFSKRSTSVDGLQHHCKACKSAYQQANPRRKASVDKYRAANREVCIARSVASQKKNRAYYNAAMTAWRERNLDRHLQTRRAHYAKNSAKDIERVRRRTARIQNVDLLSVAELAEIQGLYQFCRIFSGYEVDHEVPLNGARVSGLHVPCNLQVLTKRENRSKGNKFLEGVQHA